MSDADHLLYGEVIQARASVRAALDALDGVEPVVEARAMADIHDACRAVASALHHDGVKFATACNTLRAWMRSTKSGELFTPEVIRRLVAALNTTTGERHSVSHGVMTLTILRDGTDHGVWVARDAGGMLEVAPLRQLQKHPTMPTFKGRLLPWPGDP